MKTSPGPRNLLLSCVISTAALLVITACQSEKLSLAVSAKSIENTFEFSVSEDQLQEILKTDGEKVYLPEMSAKLNGEQVTAEEIHTRGQSTLQLPRKSFSIELDKKGTLARGDEVKRLKHFYTLSLSMDNGYINNMIAFRLMESVGLFGLFHNYGTVRINDREMGVYLFIQRPKDWALKDKDSPYIMRRGYKHKLEAEKGDKDLDESKYLAYHSAIDSIYSVIDREQGEALYNSLSQYLDIQMYMQWLAFNYLIQNGDYTDEIFLYIDPDEDRFKLIPWDYDDLFSFEPHEGRKERDQVLGGKLIFSSEDSLDVAIASDEYMYDIYLEELGSLMETLDEAAIKAALEEVYADVFPFYTNQDIIYMSKYDFHGKVNEAKLDRLMKNYYSRLLTTRKKALEILKKK